MNRILHKTLLAALSAVVFVVIAACSPGDKGDTLTKIEERGKLVAGVKYDTLLFGFQDPADGQAKGFDIDLMRSLARHLTGDETNLELREVTSRTRIPMLQNGEIDIIAATMTITEDRRRQVNFSESYYLAGQSLLVAVGSEVESIADLQGKRVVTAKGSTSARNIREMAPDAEVLEFDNYQEAFTALKSGRAEALTTDNIILMGMMIQDSGYTITGDLFTEEPYGLAMRVGDDAFTARVDQWLAEIQASGEYQEIYERWFADLDK